MFLDNESVLKVLNMYNPWWKIGQILKNYQKPIRRKAFYQVQNVLEHKEIRRFVLLSGARRVGKTTVLYQLIEQLLNSGVENKNILYVSFDNPVLKFINLNDIFEMYMKNIALGDKVYLFLDEIQYSKDWDKWLKVLYDVNPDVYAVATGSASPLILKGVAESGTGRWVTVNVPTLSFYEYCKLKGVEVINSNELMSVSNINKLDEKSFNRLMNHLSNLPKEFNKYVTIGGFPELVLSNDELYAQRILREDIVDKVLKRDLPELYNIRNISMLEKVFLYLCFNSSNIINYSNICQVLEKTSLVTVQEYIRYLESANLIYINEPVAVNGKNVLKSKPKIYIVDAAIRNAVLMNEDVIANATEMGYVVETAVYRQVNSYYGSTSHVGYYREKNNEDREIDIVVKGIRSDKYIEVKYREKSDIDSKNPLYSLPKQDDEIYVITKREMDYSVSICENGNKIVRIPAYAYLYLLGKEEYETV